VREFGRALAEAETAVCDADAAVSEARRKAKEARAACGRARDQGEHRAAELTDGARRFGVVVPAVAPDDAETVWETIRAEAARWRKLRDARAARLRVGASLAEERSRSARRSARRLRLAGAAFAGVTVVSAVLAGWAVGKGADTAVSLAVAIASAVLAVACAGAAARAQRAARRSAGGSISTPASPDLTGLFGAVSDEDAELAAAERLKMPAGHLHSRSLQAYNENIHSYLGESTCLPGSRCAHAKRLCVPVGRAMICRGRLCAFVAESAYRDMSGCG